jgi:hypothetical protein
MLSVSTVVVNIISSVFIVNNVFVKLLADNITNPMDMDTYGELYSQLNIKLSTW